MEIIKQNEMMEKLLEREFHVSKKNAGIIGMGVEIQVVVGGKVVSTEVVYGDTLYAIGRFARAKMTGNFDAVMKANKLLLRRFQYPEVVGEQ